jgi:hypothetical protein
VIVCFSTWFCLFVGLMSACDGASIMSVSIMVHNTCASVVLIMFVAVKREVFTWRLRCEPFASSVVLFDF